MPPNTLKVDRSTVFGNPFIVQDRLSASDVTWLFRKWLCADRDTMDKYPELHGKRHTLMVNLHRLTGKNLACWCKPSEPCHADILIELLAKQEIDHSE